METQDPKPIHSWGHLHLPGEYQKLPILSSSILPFTSLCMLSVQAYLHFLNTNSIDDYDRSLWWSLRHPKNSVLSFSIFCSFCTLFPLFLNLVKPSILEFQGEGRFDPQWSQSLKPANCCPAAAPPTVDPCFSGVDIISHTTFYATELFS